MKTMVVCPRCDGDKTQICGWCNGNGTRYPERPGGEKCWQCGGSGEVACSHCHGEGEIETEVAEKFMIRFAGDFYSHTMYDAKGAEVFDLEQAAQVAEEIYGDNWTEVYNGEEAISRDDWKGADE